MLLYELAAFAPPNDCSSAFAADYVASAAVAHRCLVF